MHNKKLNNNKSNSFIQGLRPFSSSIPYGLKKILKKSGYNFSNIVDNWTKMVGKDISNCCYPNSIKTGKDLKNGTIILNVMHGKELEVEYNKKNILDKINSFFGYDCVSEVKLKIIRQKTKPKKLISCINKTNLKIKEKLSNVKNSELKNSLDKLIKAYNEKNSI